MTTTAGRTTKSRQLGKGFLTAIGLVATLSLIIVTGVLIYGYNEPQRFKDLGTWGDFSGGLLNPILTFLSFMGVLVTIVLQRIELTLTRDELQRSADAQEDQAALIQKQIFDSTFFETLKLHNEIVNSIDIYNSENGMRTVGRDCFRVYYTRLTKIYRDKRPKTANSRAAIVVSYATFWKDAQLDLGHYFRFLYRFFKFIEDHDEEDKYYVKLLRSQLSDQELLLLYYNCISEQGSKFQRLAAKYQLFDNMPTVRLLDGDHIVFMPKEAFGDNPMMSPKQVRQQLSADVIKANKAASKPTSVQASKPDAPRHRRVRRKRPTTTDQ